MIQLDSAVYNSDDESHDACPTCGGHVETKAKCDASGHTYNLTCTVCPWSVPLSQPPTTTRDDAVLMTDGGHDTAHDRLAALSTEAAANVRAAIDDRDATLSGADFKAVLEQSDGEIAYLIQHSCGVEYLYRDEGVIYTRTRHSENKVWPKQTLEREPALARRAGKNFDIVARENVPAWVRGDA